jgi:hypothetical protein
MLPLVDRAPVLVQNIWSYSPYLEVVTFLRNLRNARCCGDKAKYVNIKAGTTPSSHGMMKLFETPPVMSGAGKCEESDEATYSDRTRRDA